MRPHYANPRAVLYGGDCAEVLAGLEADSVDAVITDPPYGLGFMGHGWDASAGPAFDPQLWASVGRVLKPGGHLVAFGGTRTWHRLAVAIEDAGFTLRDSLAWLYASGFPKGQNLGKAIDRAAGAEREVVGPGRWNHVKGDNERQRDVLIRPGGKHDETAPATDEARRWEGWNTALKPAFEPVILARKPHPGTVAANVLEHGTGALNVDACRIDTGGEVLQGSTVRDDIRGGRYGSGHRPAEAGAVPAYVPSAGGRYPPNVLLDGDTADRLDDEAGDAPGMRPAVLRRGATTGNSFGGADTYGGGKPHEALAGYGDTGGPSRFFPVFRYAAKAGPAERYRHAGIGHSTVKPLDLMRWLVRLVTPPGGTVLDPFAGTGTTGEAALAEGFYAVLVEREPDYLPLIVHRLTRHHDTVAHLLHRRAGGDDVDLGLLGLLEADA